MKRVLFLSMILYASLSFAAEKGDIQVIESVGEAILGDDATPAQAKAMAFKTVPIVADTALDNLYCFDSLHNP